MSDSSDSSDSSDEQTGGGGGEPQHLHFAIDLPDELQGGAYANVLAAWHSAYEFTLDFASTGPVRPRDAADAAAGFEVPCRIVSRVKIPVPLVFDVIRTLNEEMTKYEAEFGEIRRPQQNPPDAND